MIWFYLVLGVLGDTIGMVLGKKYVETDKAIFFWVAFTVYIAVTYLFLRALHHNSLTIVNMLWTVCLLVTGTLAGQLIFRDQLSPIQWTGVLVCIIGVILIQIPGK